MNNIEYLKYSLILMGQYNSTLDLDLTVHKWNRQEPPNNWTTYPPKNILPSSLELPTIFVIGIESVGTIYRVGINFIISLVPCWIPPLATC